jgi:hypothetical protein
VMVMPFSGSHADILPTHLHCTTFQNEYPGIQR